ncbi:MAG TPA: VOC family protein [Actinopolymorphaceae bacterium]
MNTSRTPTTAPAPTVWPALQARGAKALIAFLVESFGFEKTVVYADGERVAHAELGWPEGGGIMLGSHKPDAAWPSAPGGAGLYVVTDRIDEVYDRVERSGATITMPLYDTDYGSREFTVADPEGDLWSFGTYRGHARKG